MSENRYCSECMGNDRATQIQSHLANLSTEELQDRVSELILDEAEADQDTLALIDAYLDELDRRNPCKEIITAEDSLRNFHDKFPMLHENAPDKPARKVRRLRPLRYGVLVAVFVAVFGLFVVQASGVNVFQVLANWTNETFGLSFPDYVASTTVERNDAYAELQTALDEHGITAQLVPKYLPEGYEAVELLVMEKGPLFAAHYQKGNELISIRIRATSYESSAVLEKDSDAPDVYDVGGIEHHIMTNKGKYSAVWVNAGYECEILNVSSEEDLYDIIDSIYMG